MKKCIKCNELKRLDYFPKRKDSLNGYRNECKECRSEYFKNYRKNPPEKEIFIKGERRCSGCKITKPLNNFHKGKRTPDGHKAQCKECRNAKNKKHKKENPEYYKKWREDNKEHLIKYSRTYYSKNKELLNTKNKKYTNYNKEKIRKRKKKWYEKNKDRVMAAKRRRRARKIDVNENYSLLDRQITMEVFAHCCFNCSSKENLCIDHHRPLIDGNPLSLNNAVVLCKTCNSSKSTKSPENFYGTKVAKELDNKLTNIMRNYVNKKEKG